MRQHLFTALIYLALAAAVTWPAALQLGESIPGAERTDTWNSYWALHHLADRLSNGDSIGFTTSLNFPKGGSVMVNDPMGAFIVLPFAWLFDIAVAFGVLVLFQVAFAGWAMHSFTAAFLAKDWGKAVPRFGPWVSGLCLMLSPLMISHIHNGATETLSVGWTVLAIWMTWRFSHVQTTRSALVAGICLALASLAHWYGGIVAFVFGFAVTLFGNGQGVGASPFRRWLAVLLGLLLTAPIAKGIWGIHQLEDSLTGVDERVQVEQLTRTTGAADPIVYFQPGSRLSPDFDKITSLDRRYRHVHYLGLVAVCLLLWGVVRFRNKRIRFLLLGAGVCGVLSLGPVWVQDGQAVLLSGNLAIPLPYLLVEGLPGWNALAQPWRLSLGPVLTVAMLCGVFIEGLPTRTVLTLLALLCVDYRAASPTAELNINVAIPQTPTLVALAQAPDGAVIHYPLKPGKPHLLAQTLHEKPVVGTLKSSTNDRAKRFWRKVRRASVRKPDRFQSIVSSTAKRLGIRYLVIHTEPDAEPDVYSEAVRKIEKQFPDPAWGHGATRVVALW